MRCFGSSADQMVRTANINILDPKIDFGVVHYCSLCVSRWTRGGAALGRDRLVRWLCCVGEDYCKVPSQRGECPPRLLVGLVVAYT